MKRAPLVFLFSLTLLGDLLLTIKFSGNLANDILSFFLAFSGSLLVFIIFKPLFNMWKKLTFKYKSLVSLTLKLVAILLLITIALFTVNNFSIYAAKVMLSQSNSFFPFVTISLISVFLALGGKKLLLKLSVMTFPVILIIVVFIFAFSVQFMSIKYLVPHKAISITFLDTLCPLALNLLSSVVIISLFCKTEQYKISAKVVLPAVAVIALCAVNVLGVFGSEFASTLTYPYPKAVSTATMGEIFSRFDGFFYAVSFFSTLIKSGICIYLIKEFFVCFIQKISTKNF